MALHSEGYDAVPYGYKTPTAPDEGDSIFEKLEWYNERGKDLEEVCPELLKEFRENPMWDEMDGRVEGVMGLDWVPEVDRRNLVHEVHEYYVPAFVITTGQPVIVVTWVTMITWGEKEPQLEVHESTVVGVEGKVPHTRYFNCLPREGDWASALAGIEEQIRLEGLDQQ